MREAGLTAIVLQRGLPERLILAAWAGSCLGIGADGLAMQVALALDAQDLLVWGAATGAAAGIVAARLLWRWTPDAQWCLEERADGWHLSTAADPSEFRRGRVDAMLDLGGWMLLRFRDDESRRVTWLTASASRLGSAWHPLRAALFRLDGAAGAVRPT